MNQFINEYYARSKENNYYDGQFGNRLFKQTLIKYDFTIIQVSSKLKKLHKTSFDKSVNINSYNL